MYVTCIFSYVLNERATFFVRQQSVFIIRIVKVLAVGTVSLLNEQHQLQTREVP